MPARFPPKPWNEIRGACAGCANCAGRASQDAQFRSHCDGPRRPSGADPPSVGEGDRLRGRGRRARTGVRFSLPRKAEGEIPSSRERERDPSGSPFEPPNSGMILGSSLERQRACGSPSGFAASLSREVSASAGHPAALADPGQESRRNRRTSHFGETTQVESDVAALAAHPASNSQAPCRKSPAARARRRALPTRSALEQALRGPGASSRIRRGRSSLSFGPGGPSRAPAGHDVRRWRASRATTAPPRRS
jgi:hypothetical protein